MSEPSASEPPRGLPRELRITEKPMRTSAPADPLETLAHAARLYLADAGGAATGRAPATPENVTTELAVEVWRLDRRVRQAEAALDERTRRGLESSAKRLAAALERASVTWRDETGAAYNDGMRSVRVLAFEESAELAPGERRILETVRPAVFVDGEVVAVGEVIVATGPGGDTTTSGSEEPARGEDDDAAND